MCLRNRDSRIVPWVCPRGLHLLWFVGDGPLTHSPFPNMDLPPAIACKRQSLPTGWILESQASSGAPHQDWRQLDLFPSPCCPSPHSFAGFVPPGEGRVSEISESTLLSGHFRGKVSKRMQKCIEARGVLCGEGRMSEFTESTRPVSTQGGKNSWQTYKCLVQ